MHRAVAGLARRVEQAEWGGAGLLLCVGCRKVRFFPNLAHMLILPLHRPLSRATFPFVTALLILLNISVFLLQQGDQRRLAQLQQWYQTSGLAQLEWPHYRDYLEQQGMQETFARVEAMAAAERAEVQLQERLMDVKLQARLEEAVLQELESKADNEAGSEGGNEGSAGHAQLLQAFARQLNGIYTYRYLQRNSEFDLLRLFGHAFLHGDVMHLVGNMFFLAALGLLVEGALGTWRFLLLYALGILGSGLFSLAWNWGEVGGGLGASGVIAALMGAFCVLWGRRPVRFFWWFFVVFDYVRKPAIWLLPLWVGWELLNLLFNSDAGIGFDAHLGGLLSGALIGWGLVRSGQFRKDFIDADETQAGPAIGERLQQIRTLLGRMQLAEAGAGLDALEAQAPGRLDVALLRHRAAVLGGQRLAVLRSASQALEIDAADASEVRAQVGVLEATFAERLAPPGAWRARLRQRWMGLGCHAEVERLLQVWLADEADASAWFQLALSCRDAGDLSGFRRLLSELLTRFPQAPEAAKARILLEG